MRMNVIAFAALTAVCLFTVAFGPAHAADPAPAAAIALPAPGTKPLLTLAGTDSRVAPRAFHRVTSESQWQSLWREHRGADAANSVAPQPQVDFNRCTIVAAFAGQTHNCSGLEVVTVLETADSVIVRFQFPGYATGGNVEPHAVSPYGFIVLPRTDKPIVMEHNVGMRKTEQPKPEWKEAARLPAPAAGK